MGHFPQLCFYQMVNYFCLSFFCWGAAFCIIVVWGITWFFEVKQHKWTAKVHDRPSYYGPNFHCPGGHKILVVIWFSTQPQRIERWSQLTFIIRMGWVAQPPTGVYSQSMSNKFNQSMHSSCGHVCRSRAHAVTLPHPRGRLGARCATRSGSLRAAGSEQSTAQGKRQGESQGEGQGEGRGWVGWSCGWFLTKEVHSESMWNHGKPCQTMWNHVFFSMK